MTDIWTLEELRGSSSPSLYVTPLKKSLIRIAGSLEYVNDFATFACCMIALFAYNKSRLRSFERYVIVLPQVTFLDRQDEVRGQMR